MKIFLAMKIRLPKILVYDPVHTGSNTNTMRGFKFFENVTPRRASSRPDRLRCGFELLREAEE